MTSACSHCRLHHPAWKIESLLSKYLIRVKPPTPTLWMTLVPLTTRGWRQRSTNNTTRSPEVPEEKRQFLTRNWKWESNSRKSRQETSFMKITKWIHVNLNWAAWFYWSFWPIRCFHQMLMFFQTKTWFKARLNEEQNCCWNWIVWSRRRSIYL